jgi:NifU-like protein
MAKHDLIGGSLWEQYSKKVSDRMNHPAHMGEISEKEVHAMGAKLVVADWGAEACGDAVRLYWAVDPKTNIILKAAFRSFGCGSAIASCDMMSEMCTGRTVEEAIKITNLDVEQALRDEVDVPSIPPQKMHCSVMAYDVIKKAAATYKGVDMSQLEDEDIVCECARVSLRTIKDVIRINNLKTVEEITQFTKAGAFCKSCVKPGGHEERKYYLVDILKETRLEMEKAQLKQTLNREKVDFDTMTLIQKHKAVEKVLDEQIRAMLAADGGSVEVVDMQDQGGLLTVYVRYSGACMHCPSSQTGTLEAIISVLKQNLSEKLEVHTV